MQSDQQLVNQLQEAAKGAKQTLEETKRRHKVRIAALRTEQRRETERIQAQVRGYEKALRAVTKGNGREGRLPPKSDHPIAVSGGPTRGAVIS